MGGCYYSGSSASSFRTAEETRASTAKANVTRSFNRFRKSGDIGDLVNAYRAFMETSKSGVFEKFAELCGINDVSKIPNEFPGIEYEVKFDIQVENQGKDRRANEPGLDAFLSTFDFPASNVARFLKDPVNKTTEGVNNFYGKDGDERLVVIEKCGGLYLKEKGQVVPINLGIPFENIVIKRTEDRYPASYIEVQKKVREVCAQGAEYVGKIRKEKGDAFILDTNDGRLYSFTMTRAHLIRPNETVESATQRQLEIEYAGYLPGFQGFNKGSEEQLVRGMVDLAKFTGVMYGSAPIKKGWRMNLHTTSQRKYDFISGNRPSAIENQPAIVVPFLLPALATEGVRAGRGRRTTFVGEEK